MLRDHTNAVRSSVKNVTFAIGFVHANPCPTLVCLTSKRLLLFGLSRTETTLGAASGPSSSPTGSRLRRRLPHCIGHGSQSCVRPTPGCLRAVLRSCPAVPHIPRRCRRRV